VQVKTEIRRKGRRKEPADLEKVIAILREARYSGYVVLEYTAEEDPQTAVILLDVNMPDMDGFETATLIRQRGRNANTPIIFLTANADEVQAARGYALGAVDYLICPFPPDVLRTKVNVFVALSRANEQVKREAEQRRDIRLMVPHLFRIVLVAIVDHRPSGHSLQEHGPREKIEVVKMIDLRRRT
jgi:DNA-binding response OmpR family regulator